MWLLSRALHLASASPVISLAMTAIARLTLLSVFVVLALAACKREPPRPPEPAIYGENSCGGQPSWSISGVEGDDLAIYIHLEVSRSATLWNGTQISPATLNDYLGQVRKMFPQPVTALVPDTKASCKDVEAVRRVMEDRLQCSAGRYCVEYSKGVWAKRHPPIP